MAVAQEIVEEEGITGLWLGLKPGLVLTVNPAITYGLFERIKTILLLAKGTSSTKLGPWLSFLVGALSKTLATIVSRLLYRKFLTFILLLGHISIHYGKSENSSQKC